MKVKMLYYRPHLSDHSFTGATRAENSVEVREWDVLTPSLTEEVTIVKLSPKEYGHMVEQCHGNERAAQQRIVSEARWRIQHRMLSRMVHTFLDEQLPEPHESASPR